MPIPVLTRMDSLLQMYNEDTFENSQTMIVANPKIYLSPADMGSFCSQLRHHPVHGQPMCVCVCVCVCLCLCKQTKKMHRILRCVTIQYTNVYICMYVYICICAYHRSLDVFRLLVCCGQIWPDWCYLRRSCHMRDMPSRHVLRGGWRFGLHGFRFSALDVRRSLREVQRSTSVSVFVSGGSVLCKRGIADALLMSGSTLTYVLCLSITSHHAEHVPATHGTAHTKCQDLVAIKSVSRKSAPSTTRPYPR